MSAPDRSWLPNTWSPSEWVLTSVRIGSSDALGDLVQHALREPQVEERVDQQRLAVADHDAGVRLAPLAVRLQPCEHAVADLLEAGREPRRFAEQGLLHGGDSSVRLKHEEPRSSFPAGEV